MKKYLQILLLLVLPMTIAVTSCSKDDEPELPNKDVTSEFDPNFAAELEKRGYVKDAKNIILGELKQITVLNVSGSWDEKGTLTSLKGIEYFTELTDLRCAYNQLTSLDVSKNLKLTELGCNFNQLTSLDVSKNSKLTDLMCGGNQLTSLDVSKNSKLTELWCNFNQLTSLDVSKNSKLTGLWCDFNKLTSLDVSKNSKLTGLWCVGNQLTSLDVSKNSELTELNCDDNQLTSLDVSKNSKLTGLWCKNNQLTSLDVSKNSKLTELWCVVNPGKEGKFIIKAWFDNNTIPTNLEVNSHVSNSFTWSYNDETVTIDFQKVE